MPKPDLKRAMLPNKEGVLVSTVVDMNSPRGPQVLKQIAAYNRGSFDGPPASLTNLGTASNKVQGFFDRNTGRVLTSYDGKTFINDDGRPENIPGGVIPVSEQNAYTVAKSERLSADAQAQLAAIDERLIQGMVGSDGLPLKAKDVCLIRNAFVSARNGTGLWSGAASLINNVLGGLIAVWIDAFFCMCCDCRDEMMGRIKFHPPPSQKGGGRDPEWAYSMDGAYGGA